MGDALGEDDGLRGDHDVLRDGAEGLEHAEGRAEEAEHRGYRREVEKKLRLRLHGLGLPRAFGLDYVA